MFALSRKMDCSEDPTTGCDKHGHLQVVHFFASTACIRKQYKHDLPIQIQEKQHDYNN